MKDQTECRIKLHILKPGDTSVKNVWMCLNYEKKPTIEHIIDHIGKNYCDQESKLIKLYLDDYWLPPCENSRLIRENDCIKVEIIEEKKTDEKLNKKNELEQKKTSTTIKNDLNQEKLNYNKQYDYNNYTNSLYDQNYVYPQQQQVYYVNNDYMPNPMTNSNMNYYGFEPVVEKNSQKMTNLTKNSNLTKNKTTEQSPSTSDIPHKETKNEQQQQQQNPQQKQKESQSKSQLTTTKTNTNNQKLKKKLNNKEITNCYKKFSIGSYAHLLLKDAEPERENNHDDSLSEEQIIDDYYQTLQKTNQINNKTNNKKEQQSNKQYSISNVDVDKIASSIKTSGQSKWKNSTKPTNVQNKHIRFSSTSSSSSSSSTSSSDSEEESKKQQLKQTKVNRYYEPSKEEQLNAVSYNRSFVVENPKNINEFKKVFNEKKLNSPKAEEFYDKSANLRNDEDNQTKVLKSAKKFNESLKSFENEISPRKMRSISPKSPKSPKIDYEKFQPLIGAPRINDKIAFQILEISSNFTPEISDYKNGLVVDIDSNTNEVTLKLYSKYNSVLKKPSKFSVVLDDTEEEMNSLKKDKQDEPEKEETELNNVDEETLKVDWRNLINIKLLPNEN